MSVPATSEEATELTACAMAEEVGDLEASRALGIELGQSCHRMLVWECARVPPAVAQSLPGALREVGYSEQCRTPLVRELVHPSEHSVVIVPRTGRVQIRVHYLTPLEARQAAACEVARELGAVLERMGD